MGSPITRLIPMVTQMAPSITNTMSSGRRMALKDRVIFTGFVNRNDLPPYYNCADVCISCSKFETQGLSIMEAMACRKPVVCPNARAFSVIIEDGKDGFLYDGSEEGLTAAIKKALECDDTLRENSMQKARSYSEDNCARMLIDLYSVVIETKKAKLGKKDGS